MVSACGPVICVEKLEQWMPPSYGGLLVGADMIRPLCSGRLQKGDVGISPAGGWEWFRLRASSFCSGAKGTKRPPGAAHGHLQCPIPPPPDPLFFLRWSHQGAKLYPSGAGKDQDTAPRAARCAAVGGFAALRMRRTPCGCCRSVLIEWSCTPTRAIAPNVWPSRGGSVVVPPLRERPTGRIADLGQTGG